MTINDILELQDVITILSSKKEFDPVTASLIPLFKKELEIKKEAGEFTDKLHNTLKKFFPQNAPQEDASQGLLTGPDGLLTNWNSRQNDDWNYSPWEGESLQPLQNQGQPQQNPGQSQENMSPGGVALPPESYTPYRGLGEQVDLEDATNKFQELSGPYNQFQSYVYKVNKARGGYDPAFVDGLNEAWKQIKKLISTYLNKPRKELEQTVQGLPETSPRKYPQEPEENHVWGKNITRDLKV